MKYLQNLVRLSSKAIQLAANPDRFKQFLIRKSKSASFKEKLDYEILPRCNYAYGTYHAALQAKALGLPKISVIEFGVAGGNGLVALENIASEVEKEVEIEIEVYGFDGGTGLPKLLDYRDSPYIWEEGFFPMDVDLLKARLKKAELILGDVTSTVEEFIKVKNPAPIGFISFDLDISSSTVAALKICESINSFLLPRVFCYFDDCIGDDWQLHSEFTGELLAIQEFNQKNENRKLSQIYGLRYKRIFEASWNEVMYVLHLFDHPLYCQNIPRRNKWELRLR